MLELFRAGGFPMFFVVAFGLAALGSAIAYARAPNERREGFIRWMSVATLMSVLCGTAADLATVARYVATHPMEGARMGAIVVEGIGESMSPAIFGFSLLSLVAMMIAVGRRRAQRATPA